VNFSKIQGPFKTTVITNDNGKVLGKIRPVGIGKFMLTSYTGAHFTSPAPFKSDAKTCKSFDSRLDAVKAAKRIL